jgi:DNA polymerase-3 subunit epsilon
MTPLAKLRIRFAMAAVAGLAIVGAAVANARGEALTRDDVAELFMTVVGVGSVFAYLWFLVERRLLLPFAALERDVRRAVVGEPPRLLADGVDPLLKPLARALDGVIGSRERLRSESARALGSATARLAEGKRRLEAILHDLTEGVVVCALDHRIVLYNAAARRALGDLGLGRSLFEVVDEAPVAAALDAARAPGAGRGVPVAFAAGALGSGAVLAFRLALVAEDDGSVAGYVLTFAPLAEGEPTLPSRPVFYDFDLLRPQPAAGARGREPLDRLAYVVFDTETTGLDARAGDEIVQIGAVRVMNGRVLADEAFETLVNPGRPIPARSTRFHGLTDAAVADAPPVEAAMTAFRRFAGEAVLVGHNAAFDMQFLRLKEARAGVRFDLPVLDTLLLSMAVDPLEPDHSLDGLAQRFAIPVAGRHTALGDARITAEVLLRLIEVAQSEGIVSLDDAIAATNRYLDPRRRQRPA